MRTTHIYKNIKHLYVINEIDEDINAFSIDTRKIINNDCYIGIKGENNDGNKFYMDAFNKGANLVILDNYDPNDDVVKYLINNNKSIMVVEDSILALGEIAKLERSLFKFPVVAITGSAGKTSTKDMVYSVLKEAFTAHKTIGNQNNHIGLPLSILSLDKNTDMLVLEMGMNHLKEISYLTSIAKPSVAIITNVGTAHIGNLGSRENILKAKLEILEGLDKDGILIINNDNDLLHDWYLNNKDKYHIITIGIDNESDYTAQEIKEMETSSSFKCNNTTYKVPVGGIHFIYNTLVAIAVASYYNIPIDKIKNGIKNFELSSNRMHIINNEDTNITIIDDSYNANYDSMSYAIKYLSSLNGRRIAVLGTMKELGDFSEKLHRDIGKLIVEEKIDILITVGDYAKYINDEAIKLGFSKENSYNYMDNKAAIKQIKEIKTKDDKILIKASNSMNFKEIVDSINI